MYNGQLNFTRSFDSCYQKNVVGKSYIFISDKWIFVVPILFTIKLKGHGVVVCVFFFIRNVFVYGWCEIDGFNFVFK